MGGSIVESVAGEMESFRQNPMAKIPESQRGEILLTQNSTARGKEGENHVQRMHQRHVMNELSMQQNSANYSI
jgi:hypothetical protein